jgi:ABC-type amino acid transport substrate-binding protein
MYQVEGTGKPGGASIAYFEAIAAQMGYTVEWVGPLPHLRFINNLKTGENGVVGGIAVAKFAETEAFLDFPETPYCLLQPVLAIRQENPLQAIRTIDDIQGYRIGFMTVDQPYTPFLETHREQLRFETIASEDWVRQNLLKLVNDRLDAVFDRNAHTLLFEAVRLKLDQAIKILPIPDQPTPLYVGFSKAAPQSKRFVEQYNTAVEALHLSYEDLLNKELAAVTSK